ncbi:MAG: Pyridoxal phosphate homeostasis protein [Paracidovorax wautersii]|uniref:Pyridoxal phosphate homeostasis protein n=1 Tax=Paracidovorax wautersii TaxID=1177982 RepID=A0A7V8FL55_9BURK|nr:MAG: Pyridoxal phosphate homeostasis protein [Paracidovorax wautersii]
MTTIATQLNQVRQRIATACLAAGREAHSVQLLAVSKTFPAEAVAEALSAGQTAFGENYVQEGVTKIDALRNSGHGERRHLQWHCIGPLQSNKTRDVAEHFDWVQSIDRLKIAQRLSEQRPADLPPLQVCLQVNVDGGANKSGVAPQDLVALAQAVAGLPRLALRGIMSIPEPAADFAAQLALHQHAKAIFDAAGLAGQTGSDGNAIAWDTLSLGMSADLEAAIHAGSTLVRVGTAIFGGRPQPAA